MDAADFYTGIVADLYAPLKSSVQGSDPYARFIADSGEPALELGCGDGEPLLGLLGRGYVVEGVDSSADMLARCQRNAAAEGLDCIVHHQRMESLDLPHRYRTIFLAGPTFTLLPDDDTALCALRGILAHLADDGAALVPLFIPSPTPDDQLGQVRETMAPDGSQLSFCALSEERDEERRTQCTMLRYERRTATETTVVERPWMLHWHTWEGFGELALAAGFATSVLPGYLEGEFATGPNDFAFLLHPVR